MIRFEFTLHGRALYMQVKEEMLERFSCPVRFSDSKLNTFTCYADVLDSNATDVFWYLLDTYKQHRHLTEDDTTYMHNDMRYSLYFEE